MNHRRILTFLAAIMLVAGKSHAVGESSVITLVFPVGAENCGLGESGVSLAENVYSVFWNPASLPAIGEHNEVQFIRSTFYETLFPAFKIPDLWHADTVTALFLSDILGVIDLGFARHTNFINFGTIELTDMDGDSVATTKSSEMVKTYAAGIRFWDMVSVGLAVKDVDSRLAPGYGTGDEGTAQAQVLDFGLRIEKELSLYGILDLHPAVGFAIHSFPQDSISYTRNAEGADPLPLQRWYGGSIGLSILGLLGFTYVQEREYSVVSREYIEHRGCQINITPFFSVLRGEMDDPDGFRWERTEGTVTRFNFQKTLDIAIRCMSLFDTQAAEKIKGINRFFDRYHLRPNLFVESVESEIYEREGGSPARRGQWRDETTFGISILGDIDFFPKKKMMKDRTPKQQPSTDETSSTEIIEKDTDEVVE
ncbi:MAG: hypothetical protein GF344_09565 [Chitinivibrionales bacterium]|nr:hypothetical protein [Chitinivibrionales bacterium]MBD3357089.1 hypothetical protein [Chitinivibrionales bacterium]